MVNTLSGSVCAYRKETVKPRFIRIDEVMALLDVTQDEAMDIALAAGARYQLAKIILVHKERLMKFMKHSARVPSSNKIVEKKFVRIGEGSMTYSIGHHRFIEMAMIKYPKLIRSATEKLANVREDVKARDKELIDNPEFAITIGKATYTERVDGGTMMLEAISKCKTGETTAIGKFHGFELLVEKNFLGINYMVLRGKTEYKAELSTSPVGSMVKLENLFNGLHENIDFLEKKIEQYQNDLEASKAEYDKPFAYSEELEEKLARQCELNAQLDLENAKAVDADLSGPEEERETDDRMEPAAIVAEDKGAYPADREGRTR